MYEPHGSDSKEQQERAGMEALNNIPIFFLPRFGGGGGGGGRERELFPKILGKNTIVT